MVKVTNDSSLTSAGRAAGGSWWMAYSLAALLALFGGASCAPAPHLAAQSAARESAIHARANQQIVAHRGANHLAPENTLAAAQACIDRNVDFVEVDVRTSKDGVLYILHDRTLDRTTNGTGAIRDRPASYIDTLDAGGWFGAEFAGEKVPRLEQFLEAVHGKIDVYFDVKDADLNELVDLVYTSGFERDSFFWFSDDSKAKQLRRIDKNLNLKMTAQTLKALRRVLTYDPQIIECRLGALTPEFVSLCRSHGLKIMVNTLKSNSEKHYRAVINSPADMVNLNDVDLMIDLMR